ncbi:MAG: HAD-IA family hydrolase [Sphingomicrobium sp.]
MSRPPSLIIDLDGTLVDSAPLIAGIINQMLAHRGSRRTVAPADARAFLTQGGSHLVTALLGPHLVDLDSDLADFRTRYTTRATPTDCLFPGVADGLAALSALGVRMAICSNKPQSLCDKIVADLQLGQHFDAIVGSTDALPLKPAPDLALVALEQLGASAAECLYVGDSDVDRQTAANAGIGFLFVTYGYAEPGKPIDALARFDRFDQLADFIASTERRVA